MVALLAGMLIILAVCKVFIAEPPVASFSHYVEPLEQAEQEQRKHTQLSTPAPQSAPPPPAVIVSAAVSAVDSEFSFPISDNLAPTSSGLWGDGSDGGLGGGLGGSRKGGMGSKKEIESAFQGTFWDFKRTKEGKDSQYGAKNPYASPEVLGLESRFYTKFWDLAAFSPYYRSKQKLYATCFYMPNCLDKEACHAYDPEGTMGLKETRWAALYRARVKAPVTGRFRFVGAADSVMAVRFEGENVLACGLHDLVSATMNRWVPDTYPDANKGRELVAYESCAAWNEMMGGFVVGKPFMVKAGEWYDMQVLISEIGGRGFGFCLLIEEMDSDKNKKTKDGKPLLQLFRTAFSDPTSKSAYESMDPNNVDESALTDMPYDPDSHVWEAKPMDTSVKMK